MPPTPLNDAELENEIARILSQMKSLEPISEEYAKYVDRLTQLYKLRLEPDTPKPKQLSPDTVLVVAANIFGILLMTNFERDRAITSKALGFVIKPQARY